MSTSDSSTSRLYRTAGLVGLWTLLSRLTGWMQSRVLAAYLGAGPAADAFFVAYRLPNLLRRLTAEGTLTAAFLPTLSETEVQEGEAAARELVADFLGTAIVLLGFLCTLGILFMGPLATLLMGGRIEADAGLGERIRLAWDMIRGLRVLSPEIGFTADLGRIMFPYLALVSLTAAMAAVLNHRGRFGLPASVSTWYNLGFIAFGVGVLTWTGWRQPDQAARVFAFALLFAGVVQLLPMIPTFFKLGYRIHVGLRLRNPGVRLALKRMGPGTLGAGIAPVNALVSTILASSLPGGAQTVLFNATMLGEMVLGLFAVSMATASLPLMSRQAAEGDLEALQGSLASALRGTALLAIPASVGLAVLAQPIVALLLQTGRYGSEAVHWTATTLQWQAFGLLFIASGRITVQALYALKDYKGPLLASLASLGTNIVLSILLLKPLGTGGIALANGLAALLNLLILGWRLKPRLGTLPLQPVKDAWLRMGAASAFMGLVAWLGLKVMNLGNFHGFVKTALRLLPLIAFCAVCYTVILWILKVPELQVWLHRRSQRETQS